MPILPFIAMIAGLLLPGQEAWAQRPDKVARVGWLAAFPGAVVGMHLEGLRAGLASHGYVVGRNVVFEEVSAEGDLDRIPTLAEELVRRKVDVIVTQGPAVFGAVKASAAVPVVYGYSGDPVEAKFADSLARPRGNMTGQTYMSIELNGKRIEMLREVMPHLKRVAILANPQHPGEQLELADSQKTARQLGIDIVYRQATDEKELNAALTSLANSAVEALVVFPDELTVVYRARLIEFAREQRIPMVSGWSIFAKSGALLTYGPKISEVYRDLARYVVRIINGAKPADLPIERPRVFELVVNMKTANAIGVKVPPSIVLRADETID
jgi:putative ABC transport system substrate-binding protein